MPTNKSDIIRKLSNNYPNFFQKRLKKIFEIFIEEMKRSLKRQERVELRDVFSIEPKMYKSRYARNPKTNEKIFVKENLHYFLNLQKCG